VVVVVAIDQFAWRQLLAWTDKFKLEMVESDSPGIVASCLRVAIMLDIALAWAIPVGVVAEASRGALADFHRSR